MKLSPYVRPELLSKLFRFLLAGLPGLIVAIFLNLLLLRLGWPGPLAYAVVLVIQVCINFFFCLFFVFERSVERHIVGLFFVFVSGILLWRVLEWLLYVAATELADVPHIMAQLGCGAVFALAKFVFARRTIEGKQGRQARNL